MKIINNNAGPIEEMPDKHSEIADTAIGTRSMVDKAVDATTPADLSREKRPTTYKDAAISANADELVGPAINDTSMLPPSQPAVMLQPPTPQTSQEAAMQMLLLKVPTAESALPNMPDNESRSESPPVSGSAPHRSTRSRSPSPLPLTEPRRSPRIRSKSPSPFTVPSKRANESKEDEGKKRQRVD